MRILICAATRTEAQACRSAEKARWLQKAGVRIVEVIETGVGAERAGHSLQQRLAQAEDIDLVVSSGFAGALSGDLAVGTWIVSHEIFEEVTDSEGVAVGEVERILVPSFSQASFLKAATSAQAAKLVSVSKITRDASTRLAPLGAPLAVDMESAALARICRDFDLPFLALRYVTDSPTQPLPEFVSIFTKVVTAQSAVERAGLAFRGSLKAMSSPSSVLGLVRDGLRWSGDLRRGWAGEA